MSDKRVMLSVLLLVSILSQTFSYIRALKRIDELKDFNAQLRAIVASRTYNLDVCKSLLRDSSEVLDVASGRLDEK